MQAIYPINTNDDSVAKIKQLIFTRGGERLPLQYNIDPLARDTDDPHCADPQIYRNYINAVYSFSKNLRQQSSPSNMLYEDVANSNYAVDGGPNVGIGVAFDTISGEGISFGNTPFGIQMEVDLTADSPQSLYMFVHSKQTLVFNQTGIQILK